MSLTYTIPTEHSARVKQANFILMATAALDASYATGGYDVTDLLDEFDANYTILHVEAAPVGAYYFGYNRLTGKLMVFEGTAGANDEVGNGTDLQLITGVQLTVWAE
jgi:hypothetical protein